jgi:superfamily II DNA or RNA helicase
MTQTSFFDDPQIASALEAFKEEQPAPLPEAMKLRPYQVECVDGVIAAWSEFSRVLAVLPTGAGKTIIFSKVTERCLPGRTLILAHREELLQQAITKIETATGLTAEMEKADRVASRDARVVVASVQTLQNGRLASWPKDHFARIVVDEAHHALSVSYQNILEHFDQARVLGVTATPFRGDKKNLGQYFETVAYEIGLIDLIKAGYLSPIRIKSIPLKIDLSGVRSVSGDYDLEQVDQALEPVLTAAAEAIAAEATDRKVLAFLPLRKTSLRFTEILNGMGIGACHVDGTSENRKEILESFGKSEFQVLCNAMLLTEGYDEPSVDCVVVLRPTRSQPLYAQMVGRGTRLSPGKKDCLLLDFLWLHEKHSLIRPAHLVARNQEEANYMTEAIKNGGAKGMDLLEAQETAGHDREKALAKELAAQERKKAKTISIEELAVFLHDADLASYEPTMGWHQMPATESQTETLSRWKIDTSRMTRGQASQLLDKLIRRSRMKLASPNQIKWLRRYGIQNPDQWSAEKASRFLETKWGKK